MTVDRIVRGGVWMPYPDLFYLVLGSDDMDSDEITAAEARTVLRELVAPASEGA